MSLRRTRQVERDQGGFTLIELLIVIVILGVLAAVVVFAVGGINSRGTESACKSDVATVAVASEAYYAQRGSYAPAISDLVASKLLKTAPSNTNGYSITYTPATGAVTGRVTGSATSDCRA